MRPTKAGQFAKFKTPFQNDDPDQLYVVLKIMNEFEMPRVHIKAVNSKSVESAIIYTVLLADLEVVAENI